jgi:cysteine-rich repeat protein
MIQAFQYTDPNQWLKRLFGTFLERIITRTGTAVVLSVIFFSCSQFHKNQSDQDSGTDSNLADGASEYDASIVATCGNGIIESNEVCDDGNLEDGDTCSSDCLSVDLCPNGVLEGSYEYPNRNGFDLHYLSKCNRITGNLFLASDVSDNVDTLKALRTIEGNLRIMPIGFAATEDSPKMDLNGLSNLESIGGYFRMDSTALIDFKGFEHLTSIGGDFIVKHNQFMSSLKGLDSLTSIGGSFLITENGFSTSLDGPPHLVTIGGSLSINNNFYFSSDGFKTEDRLENLNGLDSLKSIGRVLSIRGESLNNIDALRNIESVGDAIEVAGTELRDLSIFSNVRSIGRYLIVVNNPLLEELFIPNSSLSIGSAIAIEQNEVLPTCKVASFKEALGRVGFSGDFSLCENQEDACGVQTCPEKTIHERFPDVYHVL